MGILSQEARNNGIVTRRTPAMVTLVAGSTPLPIWQMAGAAATTNPTNTQQRTSIIRKFMGFNQPGNANTRVQFGFNKGAGFVQQIPDILMVQGQDLQLGEEMLPNFEWDATIAVQASAAGAAGSSVLVTIEVEEIEMGAVPGT